MLELDESERISLSHFEDLRTQPLTEIGACAFEQQERVRGVKRRDPQLAQTRRREGLIVAGAYSTEDHGRRSCHPSRDERQHVLRGPVKPLHVVCGNQHPLPRREQVYFHSSAPLENRELKKVPLATSPAETITVGEPLPTDGADWVCASIFCASRAFDRSAFSINASVDVSVIKGLRSVR